MASIAMRKANATRALSTQRLHGMLKALCQKGGGSCGCEGDGLCQSIGALAVPYFSHQTLQASGKDLSVVQQLVSHTDISTTALHVKGDMASRVPTVMKVEAAV